MTSYSNYHKRDYERKKLAGFKKVSFQLNTGEAILASEVKQSLKELGTPATNKQLYMEAVNNYKNEQGNEPTPKKKDLPE
jgi:hypothetical protein